MQAHDKWGNLTVRERVAYTTPPDPTFGRLLRAHREAAGLSQGQLARLTGTITHSYVSRMESGNRIPGVRTVMALVDALSLDTDEALALYEATGAVEMIRAALSQLPVAVRLKVVAA